MKRFVAIAALLLFPSIASADVIGKTYSIANDTLNGKVCNDVYLGEIEADPGIAPTCTRVDSAGDDLYPYFATALSAPEITALDAVTAATDGICPRVLFHTSVSFILVKKPITSDPTFEDASQPLPTNFEDIVGVIANGRGRVVGIYNATGSGMEIRLVESNADGSSLVVLGTGTLADSSGADAIYTFTTTTAPRAGTWAYRLQARLNGATNGDIDSAAVSILELVY